MLNPCITINYKITKHWEGRRLALCDAHLKSKCELRHVAASEVLQYVHLRPCSSLVLLRSAEGGSGTGASGRAGSRLGSWSSGFSPGATAHLASRGAG